MLLSRVAETWERLRATRSRKAKIATVAELLAATDSPHVSTVVAYLSGRLPQGRIGLGYATVGGVRAKPAASAELTVADVDTALGAITAASGPGSKGIKESVLAGLLERATEGEQDFLRGLLLGELRQGALEGIMADAVGAAAGIDPHLVRRALMLRGDLGAVAQEALSGDAAALEGFGLELFRPLQPMLAQTADDVTSALEKTGPAAIEYKVDGARAQVHRAGGRLAVYTRRLRDITDQVPDVVAAAAALEVDAIILDGEAIALDASGRPLPFQATMSRFSSEGNGGSLAVFFFDCLHLDGRDLIDLPGTKRWQALASVIPPPLTIPRIETDDAGRARDFLDEALGAGHEGVMVKALDAPYQAGRRGAAWLKVKPAHTLDLVVLAAEWGSGRRRGRLSNLHLGARDPAGGGFVMLGKTFKGMTDEMLEWQTARFLELETHREGHVVYVRPQQVVEVAFDGIQASPRYPAGMALRFARVKGYRHDKGPEEADTIDTVREIFAGG